MYVHIFVHGYIHIYIHTSLNSGIQFYVFLVFFYFFRSAAAAAAALLPPLGVSCLFALKLLTKHQKKRRKKNIKLLSLNWECLEKRKAPEREGNTPFQFQKVMME